MFFQINCVAICHDTYSQSYKYNNLFPREGRFGSKFLDPRGETFEISLHDTKRPDIPSRSPYGLVGGGGVLCEKLENQH